MQLNMPQNRYILSLGFLEVGLGTSRASPETGPEASPEAGLALDLTLDLTLDLASWIPVSQILVYLPYS